MPRFCANLSRLFTEAPRDERFGLARACGFAGVEYPCPYVWAPEKLGDLVAMNDLSLVSITAPPGDWKAGERGLAALKGRESEFRDSIELALEYADFTECKRLNIMAGLVADESDWPDALDVYFDNLSWAADRCAEASVRAMIEPLNIHETPGYFLGRPDDALQALEEIDNRNLYLCANLYHAQMVQGGLSDLLENNMDKIAHIKVANVPDGTEPDRGGEVNWPWIFDLLDAHGYPNWVGCDYTPRTTTANSLRWASDFGISAP